MFYEEKESTPDNSLNLTRLSVNMNLDTANALRELAHQRGISYTEAVRRAISIYYFLDNETRKGRHIIISDQLDINDRYANVVELVLE